MNVKYLINICFFLVIFAGCNSEKENLETQQIKNIESYLANQQLEYEIIDGVYRVEVIPTTGGGDESEGGDNGETGGNGEGGEGGDNGETEGNGESDNSESSSTNKAISNNSLSSNVVNDVTVADVVLETGDKVTINFIFYSFQSSPSGVFFTNIKTVAEQAQINTGLIEFVPYEIIYGSTGLISGLNSGLRGVKKGKSYRLFMPSSKAYGAKQMSIIPKDNAINIDFEVVDIIKK